MASTHTARRGINWRVIGWGAAAALLLLPLIAMRVGAEGVDWSAGDFVVAAVLFGLVGLSIELLVRRSALPSYRLGAVLGVFAGLFLIWVNLAVGIIGNENDPANQLYALTIATAVGGAILARCRARGMAITMAAAAVVTMGIALVAVVLGWGSTGPVWPRDVLGASGIDAAMWLVAAALFHRAARTEAR
jgi:hypothetical protein